MGELKINVRKIEEGDFERVFFLWVQDCCEAGYEAHSCPISESKGYVFGRCLSGRGFVSCIAERDIFGFVFYGKPVEESTNCGWLYNLYVSPHFRRLGGGSRLVSSVAKEFLSQGFSRMKLNLPQIGPERARRFYQSLGFSILSDGTMVHSNLKKLCFFEEEPLLKGTFFIQAKSPRQKQFSERFK